ncbi:hypothetical protein BH11ACT7_BH11ACT7_17170 [soil metagenome]
MNSASKKSRTAAALFAGALLITPGVASAEPTPAPPPPAPDGLVNVMVGSTTLLDSVPTAQATDAVADRCNLPVEAVRAMAAQVDATGVSQSACVGQPEGEVALVQNLATGPSPVVPDTSAEAAEEPADPAAPADSEEADIEGDLDGAGAAEPPEAPEQEKPEPNNISGMN